MLSGIKVEATERESNVVPVRFSGISGNDVTRKYYKGKSFRWAGKWKSGEHYFNDEYIVDFVSIDGAMCICEKSHYSTEDNKPVLKFDKSGAISGLTSTKYWQISLNVQGATEAITEAVKYTEQNLTDSQKLRARLNIGAVSSEDVDNKIKAIKLGTSQITDGAITEDKLSDDLKAKIFSPTAVVDTEMSDASTNAVQNKVIKAYVDGKVSDLTAQIQVISGNLDAVKQDVKTEFDTLKPTVNQLKANLTSTQTELTTVKESVETNTSEISSLKADLTALSNKVDNLKPDADLVARVATLETTSEKHTEQIAGLDDRVKVLEGKTYTDSRVDDLITKVEDHETRIAALEETGGGSSIDLTEIKNTLSTHTNEITELKQCVAWDEIKN